MKEVSEKKNKYDKRQSHRFGLDSPTHLFICNFGFGRDIVRHFTLAQVDRDFVHGQSVQQCFLVAAPVDACLSKRKNGEL